MKIKQRVILRFKAKSLEYFNNKSIGYTEIVSLCDNSNIKAKIFKDEQKLVLRF